MISIVVSLQINYTSNNGNRSGGNTSLSNHLPISNVGIEANAYEKSNFSKWSDCSFETPFEPTLRDPHGPPQATNNEKIRKNLFENSYFYDQKSSQMMNCFKSGPALSHNVNMMNSTMQFTQSQKGKFFCANNRSNRI